MSDIYEKLTETIATDERNLAYLQQQAVLIDLKVKILKIIQADTTLMENQKQEVVKIILKLIRQNDVEGLKRFL